MMRHFSIPSLLRSVPTTLLQELCARLECQPAVDSRYWLRARKQRPDPLPAAIRELPREQRDRLETALVEIFDLACPTGAQALREAAWRLATPEIARQCAAAGCPSAQAAWAWLRRPDVFQCALGMQQVDELPRWRRLSGAPQVEPRADAAALREFGQALSCLLRVREGRGEACTVEHYTRSDGTDYFLAYPDDFLRTVVTHDAAGMLRPRSIRPTFEIVFAYHRERGTLELNAQVASRTKDALQELFAQQILGTRLLTEKRRRPEFDLNQLKDRYFRLDTDPEDEVAARIIRLRVDVPEIGRVTVEPLRDGGGWDVFGAVEEVLGGREVAWERVSISLASFQFQFANRGAAVECEVAHPHHLRVSSRRPGQRELAVKYLRHWRIACA